MVRKRKPGDAGEHLSSPRATARTASNACSVEPPRGTYPATPTSAQAMISVSARHAERHDARARRDVRQMPGHGERVIHSHVEQEDDVGREVGEIYEEFPRRSRWQPPYLQAARFA